MSNFKFELYRFIKCSMSYNGKIAHFLANAQLVFFWMPIDSICILVHQIAYCAKRK